MSGADDGHEQGAGRHHQDGRHQAPPDQDVAEGHDQRQADAVADLGGRHHQGGPCPTRCEVPRDQREQRLGVVEVGGGMPHEAAKRATRPGGIRRWARWLGPSGSSTVRVEVMPTGNPVTTA